MRGLFRPILQRWIGRTIRGLWRSLKRKRVSFQLNRNGAVAGWGAFFKPIEGKAGHARTIIFLGMEVNVTLRRGAGPAGIEGGIAAGPREDEAFDGPRFTTIKASPDGALFAGRFGSVNIAKNENIFSINGKANEAAHTASTQSLARSLCREDVVQASTDQLRPQLVTRFTEV